jgi:hypothetical protein
MLVSSKGLARRGKSEAYRITPAPDSNATTDTGYFLAPDTDLARAITAEQLLTGVKDDLQEMFRQGKP